MECSSKAGRRRHGADLAVEHAGPAEIVFKILRGDTFEGAHPVFEAACLRVGILDVVDAPAALARAGVERDVQHAGLVGKARGAFGAVGDQHDFFSDDRLEHVLD